jgi:peptidoglycan-associated lipoprotein
MNAQTFSIILAVSVFAVFGVGCANKKGSGGGGGMDGDYVTGSPLPERQEGVSYLSDNVDKSRFQPVYFAFDSYDVGSSEADKLQSVAEFLKSEGATIIIAGFTDERGTPEYNRGLGERRAQAVRNELIELGADGSRLQTVSFGAEMPADPGSNESAWAKNRRAEFGVVR